MFHECPRRGKREQLPSLCKRTEPFLLPFSRSPSSQVSNVISLVPHLWTCTPAVLTVVKMRPRSKNQSDGISSCPFATYLVRTFFQAHHNSPAQPPHGFFASHGAAFNQRFTNLKQTFNFMRKYRFAAQHLAAPKQIFSRSGRSMVSSTTQTAEQAAKTLWRSKAGKNSLFNGWRPASTLSTSSNKAAKATRTARKTSTQQEKPASTSSQQKQCKHFGRSKGARVCFSHNNSSKEARMREAKNRKIKAKRCGVLRGGQRAPINCETLLLTFWKVKHCKGGRGGFDGRRPKSSNKKSSNAAESGAAQTTTQKL